MTGVLRPSTWGFATRLALVAIVPAMLMLIVINVALYVQGRDEVERTLRERGELIAAALAESSYYAVISGNVGSLDRTVRELIKTDPSVAEVEILDSERRRLVGVSADAVGSNLVFEREIRADAPEISLFEQKEPHVSVDGPTPMVIRRLPVVGYARVVMTDFRVLQAQRQRLYLSAMLVLFAAGVSGFIGLYLARSLQAPLADVMRALRAIRGGDYAVSMQRQAAGEMGELQQTIAEMAAGLSLQRHEMEARVDERTRALQEAVDKASQADADKRRLLARTTMLLEDERQRIATDIHDQLNASLIVLGMKAQQIAALAKLPPDAEVNRIIESTAHDITTTTDGLYSAARAIVKELRPEVIDTLGLKSAIAEMVRSYDELSSDCRVRLFVGTEFPELRGQVAITAYRLVQEALTNIVKHARASNAWVKLDRHEHMPVALIIITDDGCGFDASVPSKDTFGLLGMRERVSACGGSLVINSMPGKGATILIRLPLGSD